MSWDASSTKWDSAEWKADEAGQSDAKWDEAQASWDESGNKDGKWDKAQAADDGNNGSKWDQAPKEEDNAAKWGSSAKWDEDGNKDAGADPWKASNDSSTDKNGWGSAGQDGNAESSADAWTSHRKDDGANDGSWGAPQQPPVRDFWDTQKYNQENGVLFRKEEWQLEQEATDLFVKQGTTAGLNFGAYEAVPVDVSGNKSNLIPICKTFEELYTKFAQIIPQALVDNVRKCEYQTPTPVQKYAIPVGLAGRDIMCCAQTGSGKTAAFLVPLIGRMMLHNDNPIGERAEPFEGACTPDVLVITPTRELCLQIYNEALKFTHRTKFCAQRIYGGESPKVQLQEICKGADIMVATPGRLQDFLDRGVVSVKEVRVLVLDEADRMLDMGFEPQVRAIVENHGMPEKEGRQTMMFSATFPDECQKMAQDFLYDYIWIGVGIVGGAVDTVEQRLEKVNPKDKYDKLMAVLDNFFAKRTEGARALVFVNAKDTAKWLDEQLWDQKMNTGALHGNLDQKEREQALARFRKGEIEVMIATDVAARGLDIESVTLVVNYDMPQDIDSYVHRIGRTGRIGNEGEAITFIACDPDTDACLEKVDTLRKLLQVMTDSKSQVPDWLEGTIETAGASWSKSATSGPRWGGTDMRSDQETHRYNGEGNEWANWKKGSADGAGDTSASWGESQQDSWKSW